MAPSIGVADYFAHKSIFITGATGFMGKVLVEKLLRSCPDVATVYLLLRPKRGQNSRERLEDFVNCRIFDCLRDEAPTSLSKLRLVAGDILKDKMAISDEDRVELEKECQIIFHCAACVRFDQDIKGAVDLNTAGTKRVLDIAERMKKLEIFLHVSTAYCNCEQEVLEERLYPSKHKPQDVIDTMAWMDDELASFLEPKLIEPQPNTYAYTKSLTEKLVSQYEGKFPIAIARPSIVTASYKEPMPGWVDNLNGPTGLLVGAGKGVIRTMQCNESYKADIIPVDMVVNGCILLAYITAIEKPKKIEVCNVSESGLNSLSWGAALEMGRVHVNEFPFSICLWYPGGSTKSSKVMHELAVLFTHVLPAYFIDLILFLLGKKMFMIRIQKKVSHGLKVLQYYTTKEWRFKNDNFLALKNKISEKDNETFFTDVKVINWNAYIRDYIKGAREFCCKEDPANLPQARKLNKKLYYADLALKCIISFFLFYIVYSYLEVLFSAV